MKTLERPFIQEAITHNKEKYFLDLEKTIANKEGHSFNAKKSIQVNVRSRGRIEPIIFTKQS